MYLKENVCFYSIENESFSLHKSDWKHDFLDEYHNVIRDNGNYLFERKITKNPVEHIFSFLRFFKIQKIKPIIREWV